MHYAIWFEAADPTPLVLTECAGHQWAASVFFDEAMALWAIVIYYLAVDGLLHYQLLLLQALLLVVYLFGLVLLLA